MSGIIGNLESSAIIKNCVADTLPIKGSRIVYGSVAAAGEFTFGYTIDYCWGVEPIATKEGTDFSTWETVANPIDLGSNRLITDSITITLLEITQSLNSSREAAAGDLEWEVVGGKLTLKRTGDYCGAVCHWRGRAVGFLYAVTV